MDIVNEGGKPYLKVEVFSRKWDGGQFVEYTEETKTGANALKVELKNNEAWKKTMERVEKEKKHAEKPEIAKRDIDPNALRSDFLRCGREGKVVAEMYGNIFDHIRPNRIKYLTFLRQVEQDGRYGELNDILKRYGK